jgi:hypothetical protein
MTRRITKAMLVEAGACADQVELFAKHFPRGVVPTVAKALAVAGLFDWDWAARALLTPAALKVYNEASAAAWNAYEEAIAPARKVRDKASAAARKVYEEASAPARKVRDEAIAAALKVYNEARAPAWNAYYEAIAAAFVTAWIGQGK